MVFKCRVGAQIVDCILLVIDVTKGIQTQTAECIAIAEVVSKTLIVVLNKMDIWSSNHPSSSRNELEMKFRKVFGKTKFGSHLPILSTSAAPRFGEVSVQQHSLVV